MTSPNREISGEIRKAGLNRLPDVLGIDAEALEAIAKRVRQFDDSQSNETRQRKAIERLAEGVNVGKSRSEQLALADLRKRTVQALEMIVLALIGQDHDELAQTHAFKGMRSRAGLPLTPPSDPQTQQETRNV